MHTQWTLQDAKNKFSEVVTAACAGTPQLVTRRGAPAVVILSVDSYSHLLKQGGSEAKTFKDLLLAMPQAEEPAFEASRPDMKLREVAF